MLIEIQIFILKYLMHSLELYDKQKLLKNVIWGQGRRESERAPGHNW